jgi:hypothetical protein
LGEDEDKMGEKRRGKIDLKKSRVYNNIIM